MAKAVADTVRQGIDKHRDWQVDSDDDEEEYSDPGDKKRWILWRKADTIGRVHFKPNALQASVLICEPHKTSKQLGIVEPLLFRQMRPRGNRPRLEGEISVEAMLLRLQRRLVEKCDVIMDVGGKGEQQEDSATFGSVNIAA